MSRMVLSRVGSVALALVVLELVALALGGGDVPSAAGPASPVAGARSLGDPFYPTLGNGGYDVGHYDLDLTWHMPDAAHPSGWLAGVAAIDLRTSQDLSELSFDLTATNTHVRHRSDTLPPMPGHPDWVARPPSSPEPAGGAAPEGSAAPAV